MTARTIGQQSGSLGRQATISMSAEEKRNAPHGLWCSREQAIALEISGVDCDCWKAKL